MNSSGGKISGHPCEMRMAAVLSVIQFERESMLWRSILFFIPSGQTLSKALETSRRTTFVLCFFLLGVGYDSMEDGEGSVRPSTSSESVLVVVVEVVKCEVCQEFCRGFQKTTMLRWVRSF